MQTEPNIITRPVPNPFEEFRAKYPHADGPMCLTVIQDNGGFMTSHQLAILAVDPRTRLTQVLVRCGSCRFVAGAQDIAHLIAIIERDGRDYVRDVSLPAR